MAALTIYFDNATAGPLAIATGLVPPLPLDPGGRQSVTFEADDFDAVRVRIETPASLPLVANPPAEPETPEEERAA